MINVKDKYKILVVSDSHGKTDILDRLYKMYPDCDYYLHAGDSCDLKENLGVFLTVKGNNDRYITNDQMVLKVGSHNIYMTHGHKMFLFEKNIIARSNNFGCDIFIHGHTHKPYYNCVSGIHVMCPGSLAYPRSTLGETYIILEIDKERIDAKIVKLN